MIKFSLIMATIGRYDEVRSFLESIDRVNYKKELIEILIVDQNKELDLSSIVKDFNHLNINHIKSEVKGLSQNRLAIEYIHVYLYKHFLYCYTYKPRHKYHLHLPIVPEPV